MRRSLRPPSTTRSRSSCPGWPRGSPSLGGIFDYEGKREKLEELDAQTADPEFWGKVAEPQAIVREQSTTKKVIDELDAAQQSLDDVEVLYELAREESDASVEPEIEHGMTALGSELDTLELRALFTGEHDERDAI